MKIEAIENEVRTNGGVRDYGIYEDSDVSDTEDVEIRLPLNPTPNVAPANVQVDAPVNIPVEPLVDAPVGENDDDEGPPGEVVK